MLAKMSPFLFKAGLLMTVAMANVGGCNLYTEMSRKDSDEAIVIEVKKLIDASLWTDAIAKWNTLSTAGQAVRANKVLLASAYAGAGGLNMLRLAQSLQSGMGTSTLFQFLLSLFKGNSYLNYTRQVAAQDIMLGISATASGRTGDENTFLLFVELAKLGTLFAALADSTQTGTVDATWDNCAMSAGDGAQIITGLGNIFDILTAIGTSLVGANLAALQAACVPIEVLVPGACTTTDATTVSASMIQIGQTLAGESNLGIGLAAPYNDPYCQLTNAPIAPQFCPGNTGPMAQTICP
jgi:hypothetical protein